MKSKKHGLSLGVDYELFPPVIDKNGYDLLIKHGRNMKAFQLKTVAKSAKTSYWDINKKFLRPDNLKDGGLILHNFSADLAGLGGGVIIMEYDFDTNSELRIEYYYFDYQILYFFQKGIFRWFINNASYCDIVTSLFEEGKKPFKLQKSLLYKTTGIKDLLMISRMEPLNYDLTRENTKTWTFDILNFGTGIQNMTIHRNGIPRNLEVYDTSLIRKKMIVGDRVFESIQKN